MKKNLLFLMLCLACFGVANAQTTLLSENFDNMSSIATSYSATDWFAYKSGNGNNWTLNTSSTYANSGSKSAQYQYNNRNAANCYLVSAPFSVSANMVELNVSLYERVRSSTYAETFEVFFVKASDVTSAAAIASATHYNAIASANYTNTSYAEKTGTVANSALAGESVRLVVHCTSAANKRYLYIDDITVTETTIDCIAPRNLAVTTDGAIATVTWDGTASNGFIVDINGTQYTGQTSPYTFNVALSTTYNVTVTANCGSDGLSTPVTTNFTTPDCIGGHTINYSLADSYGDGWNGNAIEIVDVCGNVIETLTIENGTSNSGTLNLCGSYYQFTWTAGQYASEASFTLTDNGTAIYTNQSGSSLTNGQVLHTIGTPVPAPTGLTAGTTGMNSVVLNWAAGGSETAWQICINGDETNLITANTNVDYTLSNLLPETDYSIKVRAYIGANTQSCWSNTVSFTTEASNCPKPTNVTASNITVNSAHISWNGEADNYNVRYATATVSGTTLEEVFFDDFENGFDNWTTYALGEYTDDTWALTNSTSLADYYHSGSYGALTRSYYNGNDVCVDNWLVSPQMTFGDVLKFWVLGDNNNYQEYFAVYVSTGTNAASDFVMVEAPELAPGDGTWAERTVDLSAYAGQQGYIAIRHTDCAQDFLILDDFGVYKTVNAYSYGTFTTLPTTTETSSNITGLNPETLYIAQVQADCGDPDGTSTWHSVYFTTPDACGAPTDLVTSNITATTATLGWADNQDSYNVRYRKVYFYEDFEGETLPTGWMTIDANNDGLTWGVGHATTHSGNNGAANLSYIYSSDGSVTTTPDDYLVSPLIDLQGTLRVWLSGITASTNAEHFEILLSTTGNSASDFTTTLVSETTTSNAYVEYTADLSSYVGQQGYIAIHHFNCTNQRYLYVDDFGLYGSENWVSVNPNPTDATTTLTGLQPITNYEWQVQGNDCDGNGGVTEWSESVSFETVKYPVTVTITGNTSTVEYNGEAQEVTGYTATASNELYDVTSDFTFAGVAIATGTNASADTIYMGLAAEQFGNTNPMFDVTFEVEDGWLVITPAAMTVTVTGHTSTVAYDGESHTVTGYDLTCDNTMYSESLVGFTGTASAARTDAGTTNMGLAASQFSYNNSNFDVTFEIVSDGGLTINKKSATVVADNLGKTYGEADPELTATVEGTVGEDVLAYTLSREEGDAVGEYAITVTLGENPNYEVSATNGVFTISKKTATVVADNLGKTYGDQVYLQSYQCDQYHHVEGNCHQDTAPPDDCSQRSFQPQEYEYLTELRYHLGTCQTYDLQPVWLRSSAHRYCCCSSYQDSCRIYLISQEG